MRFNPATAKPRQVEAYLREQVRKCFGDAVENASSIHSSHGYYTVNLKLPKEKYVDFDNFRKTEVPQIVKAMQALKSAI